MGQKTNPIIFRLGVNKTWNTEFFETKNSELSSYTFKNIEITEYIKKFLINNNLILHSYKIHYNQSLLNIYISYFIPISFKFNKNNFNNNIETIDKFKQKFQISKFYEGLNIYTGQKLKIVTIFNCINKNLYYLTQEQIIFLKARLTLLKKFRIREDFNFDETFDIVCNSIFNAKSSFMLGSFIAEKLKKIKKHNRFLSCVNRILELLIQSNFSKIKGIKIKISGKLNRSRRTKTKTIKVGTVPTQTINEKLDYSQITVTHNPNGSFGVKIWMIEK